MYCTDHRSLAHAVLWPASRALFQKGKPLDAHHLSMISSSYKYATLERVDQGHLLPLLELPRVTCHSWDSNPGREPGTLAKNYSNSLLITIQNIYMSSRHGSPPACVDANRQRLKHIIPVRRLWIGLAEQDIATLFFIQVLYCLFLQLTHVNTRPFRSISQAFRNVI